MTRLLARTALALTALPIPAFAQVTLQDSATGPRAAAAAGVVLELGFGRATGACSYQPGLIGGHVELGRNFAEPPVFVATIDETFDNTGATFLNGLSRADNRMTLLADAPTEAVHWLAVEPGVHDVDGKTVQAGRHPSPAGIGSVFFPQSFSAPPVVLVFLERGPLSTASVARVIGAPSAGGFQYFLNGSADTLGWIAMDAGDYVNGSIAWTAGTFANPTSGATFAFTQPLGSLPTVVLTVHDTDNNGGSLSRLMKLRNEDVQVWMNAPSELLHYVALTRNP